MPLSLHVTWSVRQVSGRAVDDTVTCCWVEDGGCSGLVMIAGEDEVNLFPGEPCWNGKCWWLLDVFDKIAFILEECKCCCCFKTERERLLCASLLAGPAASLPDQPLISPSLYEQTQLQPCSLKESSFDSDPPSPLPLPPLHGGEDWTQMQLHPDCCFELTAGLASVRVLCCPRFLTAVAWGLHQCYTCSNCNQEHANG